MHGWKPNRRLVQCNRNLHWCIGTLAEDLNSRVTWMLTTQFWISYPLRKMYTQSSVYHVQATILYWVLTSSVVGRDVLSVGFVFFFPLMYSRSSSTLLGSCSLAMLRVLVATVLITGFDDSSVRIESWMAEVPTGRRGLGGNRGPSDHVFGVKGEWNAK